MLAFGGTKNGTAAGELVIFFKRELAEEFDYRAKQGGQLASKMRFLAAPWAGLLTDDVWLRNARQANESARQLAEKLQSAGGPESIFPREASAIFCGCAMKPSRNCMRAAGIFTSSSSRIFID